MDSWGGFGAWQWWQLGGQSLLLLGLAGWVLAGAQVLQSGRRRARRRAWWLGLLGGVAIALSIEGDFWATDVCARPGGNCVISHSGLR